MPAARGPRAPRLAAALGGGGCGGGHPASAPPAPPLLPPLPPTPPAPPPPPLPPPLQRPPLLLRLLLPPVRCGRGGGRGWPLGEAGAQAAHACHAVPSTLPAPLWSLRPPPSSWAASPPGRSSLSAVFVLVAGALAEGAVFPWNLGRLGNAFTLWLGIDPPDLFFYAFLPPLLLHSALSIDYFLFNKVMMQVMVFAFLVVLLSTLLATPVLLYGLRLAGWGWRWQHGALFSAMLASTDALAITAVLRRAGGPESLITLMEGESLLNDASGIVLFQLFHSLVQQLPAGGGSEGVPSPLSVLPLMASQIAQLAAGGVVVGLAAGMLTRRLLRALRWHGASACQEVAAIQAMGFLVFYIANAPLQVSGVIAVVVFGLYGNSTSHFELASSRHMRESAAVQNTVSFALNGVVFFFAGASACNFMIRAVESLSDYWHSFALFPPVYLAMFLIRGISILLFNPLFHLLGSQALPLRAVLFATWGGLRGAISLIMAQVIATDETVAGHSQLVSAQMGLWTSLFVLSTLLINAPTVPAVLRFTGLTQVSPVKLSIREKAKRALLRYTAAAIQDLKNDEDEMLRGVDWGAVARYVDLSEELQQFSRAGGGAAGEVAGAGAAPRERQLQREPPSPGPDAWHPQHQVPQHRREGVAEGEAAAALEQQEELFDSAGWAAPSSFSGSARSRREAALAGLGKLSNRSPLSSSRRLLGASLANFSHKWEPRSGPPLGPCAPYSDGIIGGTTDLEMPLLPASPSRRLSAAVAAGEAGGVSAAGGTGRRAGRMHRSLSAASGSSARSGASCSDLGLSPTGASAGTAATGERLGVSRSSSVDRLTKYGSSEFSDESPFFPAAGAAAAGKESPRLASAKSAPQMHTIVEVASSEEEGGFSSEEDWAAAAAAAELGSRQPLLVQPEDSSRALHEQQAAQSPQSFAPLDFEVLPSFPSDAAFSMPDSGAATPTPNGSFSMLPGASGSSGAAAVGAGSSSFAASLPGSGPGPDLAAQPPGAGGGISDSNAATADAASTKPPPLLRPLRLGRPALQRTSAPGATTAAASRPMSPRGAPARPPALEALAAEAASGPQSPRSMHGLVRTSLLPATADRQAVQHVSELMSGDEEPSLQDGAGSCSAASQAASPRATVAAHGSQPTAAMGAPSASSQLLPSAGSGTQSRVLTGRGPSSLLRPSLSDTARGGSGLGGRRGFGGLLQARPSDGLAAVLQPPSPGRISPLTSSAATSPEPSEQAQLLQPRQGQGESREAEEALPPEQPPLPLLDAAPPDAEAGQPGASGETADDADAAEEEIDTGLELEGALPPPGGLPGFPLRLPTRAMTIAGIELGRSFSLAVPAAPHPHHVASAAELPPPAGAGVAVAASFAGTPGVKPWQAGALLLRRSMSTPLTGIAEQLEQQQKLPPGLDAASAAGESAAGGGEPGAPSSQGGSGQWSHPEVLAEARMRLVAGLKRYFHAKRGEGLLSAQGLRILDYACDRAIDQAQAPLGIWSVAEGEAVGKYLVRALAWLFFRAKRLTGRLPRWLRFLLMPPLRWFSGLIGCVLSVTMLVACEVAVEYWMALTWSPQAQWLRESEKAGELQAEIAEESARVCKFIIDREIEAPERFQAIQSYRAAMAILRQQSAFVDELYASGIVNDSERQVMQEPVQRRGRQLEIQGPVWRAPSVREVLRGLPFLHHVPDPMFDWLLERGQLLEYTRGEVIRSPAPHLGAAMDSGLYIVVYGLVRSSFTDHRGACHEYFLGSGGVLGLLGALTGQAMRGSGPAVAEANALHKGPVIFHIPQGVIKRIRQRGAAGDHDFAQLELDLFRVAGLYIVERLKGEVVAAVAARFQRQAIDRARRRAIHKAAAAAAAASNGVTAEREREVPQQEAGGAAGEAPAAGAEGARQGSLRQRVHWDSSLGEEQASPVQPRGGAAAAAAAAGPRPFVPLSDAEVLAGVDRRRLWHNAQAFARGILADIRHHLRDAELLRLGPKQAWRQRSHMLLVHGSLHSGGVAAEQQAGVLAPAVLPWLAAHLQCDAGALPGSPRAAAPAQRLVAGPDGALLLACPEERGTPLTPSSSAGSTPDFGSPFAGAAGWPGSQQPQQQEGVELQAGSTEQGGDQRLQQEQQEHLEPAGRPLRRVKSRRLPLSTAHGLGTQFSVGRP